MEKDYAIITQFNDGKYRGILCVHKGKTSDFLEKLTMYNTPELVQKLISLGDVYRLGEPEDMRLGLYAKILVLFSDISEFGTIADEADSLEGILSNMGYETSYIWDNGWFCYDGSEKIEIDA